jgi:hypothetical protein
MITLYQDEKEIFSMGALPNEAQAGLAIALYLVLSRVNTGETARYFIEIDGEKVPIIRGDSANFYPQYIQYANVNKNYELDLIKLPDCYLWPIMNENKSDGSDYHIYSFDTNEFIQGFITGISYFDLDFRDFAYCLPYRFSEREKEYYIIDGYDAGWITPVAPVIPPPFSSNE